MSLLPCMPKACYIGGDAETEKRYKHRYYPAKGTNSVSHDYATLYGILNLSRLRAERDGWHHR